MARTENDFKGGTFFLNLNSDHFVFDKFFTLYARA